MPEQSSRRSRACTRDAWSDGTTAGAEAERAKRTQADEARRIAYREALHDAAAPLFSADARLRGADEQMLLDIFECADLELSGEQVEFGLALRLVQITLCFHI